MLYPHYLYSLIGNPNLILLQKRSVTLLLGDKTGDELKGPLSSHPHGETTEPQRYSFQRLSCSQLNLVVFGTTGKETSLRGRLPQFQPRVPRVGEAHPRPSLALLAFSGPRYLAGPENSTSLFGSLK